MIHRFGEKINGHSIVFNSTKSDLKEAGSVSFKKCILLSRKQYHKFPLSENEHEIHTAVKLGIIKNDSDLASHKKR